jgi:AcrR family transcriptional regulator
MRARKELEREQRRNSIIEAAEELLNEKTFDAITVDDIAIRSDFAKASIYQYFINKDELMSEVFSKALEMQCSLIEEKCFGQTDPIQSMRNYIRLEFEFNNLYPWSAKVRATRPFNGFNVENRLVGLYDQKKKLIAAIIQRGQTEGTFIAADLDVLTEMILGVSTGFANYFSSTHMSADLKNEVIETFISTIMKGIAKGEQ